MSATATVARATSVAVCLLRQVVPDSGVAALVSDHQVAIFRRQNDRVYAVDNFDPYSGANVISRGIVGDVEGEAFVASPIHKQRFSLTDGHCLDGDDGINSYPCEVIDDVIYVQAPDAG